MFLNNIQKNKKTFLFFINILLCVLMLSVIILSLSVGCKTSRSNNETGSDESRLPDDTTLRVGCDPTYPVFEFIKDGNIEGFDIDIAREISERMGRELKIISIDWDSTYKIPEDLKLDMVISAVPISSEKENIVDFSIPYFTMEYMLVVLTETDIKIKEDLEGKSVGMLNIEKRDLSEDYLLNYKIEGYDDVVMMIDDLKNKNIDGILISLPMGVNLITGNIGIYNVLEVVKSNKEFGIVFNEGSTLKEEVDNILNEIKEDGTYDEIYNRWFDYSSLQV